MKRGRIVLAAAATVVAAFGVLPGRAAPGGVGSGGSSHPDCTPVSRGTVAGHGFKYCGYHWPASALPISFSVKGAGPGVSAAAFVSAARNAAAAWNAAWPVWAPGKRAAGGACTVTQPLCYDPTGTSSNSISFGNLPSGIVARAYVTSSGTTITGASIVLNNALSWKAASTADLAAGEAPGVAGPACLSTNNANCPGWHDVQNIITHEFGHVLGLEDLGHAEACWPADLRDAANAGQTMYTCMWPGDTSKRTLSWGDLAGVTRVAEDTM